MAELNCTACEDLREEVPQLIVNGFDNTMCTSLKNDTGLKSSSGHNDCTDLDTMNDCLIGNMETEIDRYDTCEWKPFTKKFIDNIWTMGKAMICAICGLWTNVHSLWATIRSLCLKKEGNKIVLYSNLGDHCSVTDNDTKYDLTKDGSTIKLVGSDGTVDSVTDDNTKYDLSISGHTVTMTGTDGSSDSVTVPDNDTKYGLSISGDTVSLVEGGTNPSVTIPDDNTTYSLSKSGDQLTLTGSDGSTDTVTVSGQDTWKPNTASQEGYVEKGEDDPHAVWATGSAGGPAWRHSPTLSGSLTLYDHDGPIGERLWWQLDNTRAIANDTEVKIATITLTPGVWVVLAVIGYESNGDGGRAIGLSFGASAPHHKGLNVRANTSAHTTVLSRVYIRAVAEDETDATVYLDAYQDSGSSLNITTYPETYVSAVRIS